MFDQKQQKDHVSEVNWNSIQTNISICSDGEDIFKKYKDMANELTYAFRLYTPLQFKTNQDDSSIDIQIERRTRGCYRKYTLEEKQEAVKKMMQGTDVKEISKAYSIPRRNLLRWKKNGCQRKEGGGRPTDSDMELALYAKIKDKSIRTEKQIRTQAKRLTSKGWYCKFCRRYNIWNASMCENMNLENNSMLSEIDSSSSS